jgi:surface antigen
MHHVFTGRATVRKSKALSTALVLFGAWLAAEPVLATPPPWAPAHGWRQKNDPFYVGYAGHQWSEDYGVMGGRCNTDTVLAVVGATAGGVIANRTSSEENRTIATIVGAVVGGLVGNTIGEKIDKGDRACVGHALELARVGQKVRWTNPATGLAYTVRPTRDLPDHCRQFELSARSFNSGPLRLTGCARRGGEWELS